MEVEGKDKLKTAFMAAAINIKGYKLVKRKTALMVCFSHSLMLFSLIQQRYYNILQDF